MSGLRSGIVLLLGAAVAGGAAFWLVYGPSEGLLTGALMLGFGAPAVAGAHLLAARRRRLGSLSRQFSAGVAMTVALATTGVGVIALLMFVSAHDAFTMVVLLVFAGILTAHSASVLAAGIKRDIDSVGRGVGAIGAGERSVEIATEADDEIAGLAASAEQMAARLAATEAERERAEGARRDLVAAVSHDLRTPLTSLRLLAEAIEDGVADPETTAGYRRQLSLHVASLSALVDDLFELSRMEAGEISWSMQQVALAELVQETVEAMRPQADDRRVAVLARVDDSAATAQADPEKVQRVLFNLIQNAIRHTPADGSVTVAAQGRGATVEIQVADTGEGVAAEDRERAFEPFYRGDGGARSGEGAGLGLAICRAIVEAHGGRIWFADASAGACVRFSLPVAD